MKDISIGKVLVFIMLIVILIIGLYNNFALDINHKKLEEQALLDEKEIQAASEDKKEKDQVKDREEEIIYIHITGAIKKPGLYKLKAGSRLDDLVKLAGGLDKKADIAKINLSMILEDEMRLHILSIGEVMGDDKTDIIDHGQATSKSDKININKASLSELMTLPGIGEKRAQEIIEYRKNKKFTNAEDLKEIPGIGDKSMNKLRDLISY